MKDPENEPKQDPPESKSELLSGRINRSKRKLDERVHGDFNEFFQFLRRKR